MKYARGKHPNSNGNGFKKGNKIWLGRKLSEEHKKKLSVSKLGNKNPLFGKQLTLEHRTKISNSHKGEKSHYWKGGLTKLSKIVRNSFKYRQWRSDVFTRDNFTCAECDSKGGRLEADHIIPFSFIYNRNNIKTYEEAMECEELWNINNGRTLCRECHSKTDTYLFKANNFTKQPQETGFDMLYKKNV